MPSEPAMSGEITAEGMLDILREIESRRITGRLRFTASGDGGSVQTGEVELIAGQIALDQDPLPDGSDPVERLLSLRGGLFVVHQRLPPLPISKGDDLRRTGSLAVHVPADLMNYCEQGGLTGTLTLAHESERVELVYASGELLAIRVDGRDDGDLSHVFGWDDGTFDLEVNANARSLVPEIDEEPGGPEPEEEPSAREPTTQFVRPRTDDTGRHFLKVLEVALTTIVDQRERARPSSRSSPIRADTKSVRPRPATMPALGPQRKREPTVRVVYLKPDDPTTAVRATDTRTRHTAGRHAGGRVATEEALPDAQPSRRRDEPRGGEASGKPDVTPIRDLPRPAPNGVAPPARGVAPLVWVIAVIAIGLFVIGLLTQLPGPR